MRKIFANLKAVVGAVVMVSMLSTAALSTSCSDYDDEINDLQGQIDDLAERVSKLESDFQALAGVLDGIVLNAEQNADGNWVITTEGGKINITVEGDFNQECAPVDGGVTVIEEGGVYYWAIIENGQPVALTVDGAMVPVVNDVTLAPEVRQNPVSRKTEFTVDGENWYEIGVVFQDVAVDGNNLVLTLGAGNVVTVPMAGELVFEVNSGRAIFSSEQVRSFAIITKNIDAVSVLSAPKGWTAAIDGNKLVVTAPNEYDTEEDYDENWNPIPATADANGEVKVLGYGNDGRTLVGKLAVALEGGVAIDLKGNNVVFTGGMMYGYWPIVYYYGISTEENYEADALAALEAIKNYEMLDYMHEGEGTITVSISELLGGEPEVGVRYVVWAYAATSTATFKLEQMSYVYYNPIGVTATLIEDKTTAYNVEVSVEVTGADSYLALVMPETYMDDAEYMKENMVSSMVYGNGNYYGQVWDKNYTGSLDGLTANSQYSMTGQYAPQQNWYLFILPIDGRDGADYTTADVRMFEFKTLGLEAGGSVTATVAAVESYMKQEWDWTYNEYVLVEKQVDPMTQLAVSVDPSEREGWSAYYSKWYEAEEYALLGSDEAIVDDLLGGWGMTPEEVESYPIYELEQNLDPESTMTFVCFFVDKSGKYGELAKYTGTTKKLEFSDMTFTVESNLGGIKKNQLENTQTLELTLNASKEVKEYRYVAQEVSSYNQYAGKTAAEMATAFALNTMYSVKTIEPSQLENGVWKYSNHGYGNSYYLAMVAVDTNGAVCSEAVILEYDCKLILETVIDDPAQYVGEPTIEFTPWNVLTEEEFDYNGGECCTMDYIQWYNTCRYQFYFHPIITAAEGTEAIMYILMDESNYMDGLTSADKAADLWAQKWGNYYSPVVAGGTTQEWDQSIGYYTNNPKTIYMLVSWKDAEGNIYYKEQNLTETMLQEVLPALKEQELDIWGNVHADVLTDQWNLPADVAAMVATEGAEGIVDLGVTAEGQMMIAFNLESVYGPDAAGMWQTMMAFPYTIEATSTAGGNIVVAQSDMFGDTNYTNVPYTVDLESNTVTIDFSFLGCENSTVTPYDGEVVLETGGGMAM